MSLNLTIILFNIDIRLRFWGRFHILPCPKFKNPSRKINITYIPVISSINKVHMQRAIPKTFQIFYQYQKGCQFYFMKELIVLLAGNNSVPTNIESPRQSNSILWRTISFGSSGLFQLFRMWPYPKYWNIIIDQDNYMQYQSKYLVLHIRLE